MSELKMNWFGAIPVHWGKEKVGNITNNTAGNISLEELKGRTFYYYDIPTVQIFGKGRIEEGNNIDSNKYKIRGGELLVSKLNPRKGTVVLTEKNKLPIICSTEFVILDPTDINGNFLYYIMSSEIVADYLNSYVKSVTNSHQRVNPKDIKNLEIPIPCLEEQNLIVEYLDYILTRIDSTVTEKEKILKLLEEYQQSIVTETVTKGLNPNVKMKDSGVEWIGEIPEHWKIGKIKEISEVHISNIDKKKC